MSRPDVVDNTILFIAHPGHELCVYGWTQQTRPVVCVLTDGSGHDGQSRINSTTRLLRQAGASPGSIYGPLTDAEVYRAILNYDIDLFAGLAGQFADELTAGDFTSVAGDAIEGFNPAHDLCRLIINAGVMLARQRSGKVIVNREFPIVAHSSARPTPAAINLIWTELTDEEFEAKLKAARAYEELQPEVDAAFTGAAPLRDQSGELAASFTADYDSRDIQAYRVEMLRSADEDFVTRRFLEEAPFYERYGESRVSMGYYQDVIRYREHMLPLAQALASKVNQQYVTTAAQTMSAIQPEPATI
jgi:hypothetical protein